MPGRQVATRYLPVNLTVAAGTTAAAPASSVVNLLGETLEAVELLIPPGHSGLTGFAVLYAAQVLVPWSTGPAWVVGDGQTIDFDVDFDVDGPLTLRGYNTDVYPHTFYVRLKVRPIEDPTSAPVATIVPVA